MSDGAAWLQPQTLRTERLDLEPLRAEHATEMAPLLDDPALHCFIGGAPAGAAELRDRYERQAVGHAPDGSEGWLNWIVRRRDNGQAVGTVQATVTGHSGHAGHSGHLSADVAWVIGSVHQGRGYAREAARAMVEWLRQEGAGVIVAYVHPEHGASIAVARAIGLRPTVGVVDGEIRWASAD